MAVPTANVIGNVLLPDGVGPRSGHITVELMLNGTPVVGVATDTATGSDMKVGGRKRYQIADGGAVNFQIVPNDTVHLIGGESTTYRAQMELVDADGFSHFKDDTWTVSGVGSKSIGDL